MRDSAVREGNDEERMMRYKIKKERMKGKRKKMKSLPRKNKPLFIYLSVDLFIG